MPCYISILRGINVSGRRMIKMAELKKLLESQGFSKVQTYIQSGNIIFESNQKATESISDNIKTAILKHFGHDVPVITFTLKELKRFIAANPFAKDKTKDAAFFHITFLAAKPTVANIEMLEKAFVQEDYKVSGKVVYLYCPNGYSNTKLTNTLLESKLKTNATTRNWKTVLELLRIAENI